MIELTHLKEINKVYKQPKEIQENIKGILAILDEEYGEYGENRDQYKDDGGYVIVIEEEADFQRIKEKAHINVNDVIMRTYAKRKDGTKRRNVYYCCGAWKNKGSSVCHSNAIRVDKANEYVFGKLSELLNNDKLVKDIVNNINSTRKAIVDPSKGELEKITRELDKIEAKKKKLFEAYEEEIISKDDFKARVSELKEREKVLQEDANDLKINVMDDDKQEVSYEIVKETLSQFGTMISNCEVMEQKKKLLRILISKITINELREIDSIQININDNLIAYLNSGGEPNPEGSGSSFSFDSRRKLMINSVNIRICI